MTDLLAAARRDPLAKKVGVAGEGVLVFPAQLAYIRRVARQKGFDADEVCRRELRCNTEDLSFTAAEDFIAYLSALETETT